MWIFDFLILDHSFSNDDNFSWCISIYLALTDYNNGNHNDNNYHTYGRDDTNGDNINDFDNNDITYIDTISHGNHNKTIKHNNYNNHSKYNCNNHINNCIINDNTILEERLFDAILLHSRSELRSWYSMISIITISIIKNT